MCKSVKTKLARNLGANLSKPEVYLWVRLRRNEDGFHFRRQHPIGPYVADIYKDANDMSLCVWACVHDAPSERFALTSPLRCAKGEDDRL